MEHWCDSDRKLNRIFIGLAWTFTKAPAIEHSTKRGQHGARSHHHCPDTCISSCLQNDTFSAWSLFSLCLIRLGETFYSKISTSFRKMLITFSADYHKYMVYIYAIYRVGENTVCHLNRSLGDNTRAHNVWILQCATLLEARMYVLQTAASTQVSRSRQICVKTKMLSVHCPVVSGPRTMVQASTTI